METMLFVWIGLMVVFGVLEASTVNMVSIWFVGGSLAALIVCLLGGGIWLQIAVCLIVAVVMLAALRPFVRKFITPKKTATNVDMIFGRTAYITQTVDNLRGTGSLRLDGKDWTVRSMDGSILPEGSLVKIIKLEGVKLFVEPAHETVC